MGKRKLTPFRKKYLRFKVAEARRNLKIEAVAYKGGKCDRCGYDKCPAALVFHHPDPTQKDFGIAEKGRSYRNLEVIKEELDKCILLCSNCHLEVHYEEHQANRLIKMQEIEKEKHTFESSIDAICSLCSLQIKVFVSHKKLDNFCSTGCKKAYFFSKGWLKYNELIILKNTMSVKEIAKVINKSTKTIYDRFQNLVILNQKQQNILINFLGQENKRPYDIIDNFSFQKYDRQDIDYLIENKIIENIDTNSSCITDLGYKLYKNF